MLRRDGLWHPPGTVAHLWPFARALVATLDVAGIPATHTGERAAEHGPLIARRLAALERYWDPDNAAYASDPPGTRLGGDIYYDDNAWVGLALVQLERLAPGTGRLDRAAQIAAFARGGWDRDLAAPHPGGVFWVRQGGGLGARNHDRNTVSTAPHAQLALHLDVLGAAPGSGEPTAAQMCAWVEGALDAGGDGAGLYWDNIRGDHTIDRATWSYNQGSMLGLNALLAARGDPDAPERLRRAQTIATRALDHYAQTGYAGEPPAFVAIFVRNLLTLHAAGASEVLRARIAATLRERADALWASARDGLAGPQRRPTLLDQSALASLQALAAWDPSDYAKLA